MKTLLSLIISGALVVSGYSQTRNVLVGTNNAVVQPTNFWSVDASNARTGLGLGSAATNPASAFQPSSAVLSNLASSNGANLTNIPLSGVVGALATNGSAAGLTNFPASLLVTNGSGAGLTNLTAANITGTVGLASNVTGTIAVTNGGTGATNAAEARTNFGLGWSALTNTNASTSLLGFTTNGQVVANTGTNVLSFELGSGVVIGGDGGTKLTVSGDGLSFYSQPQSVNVLYIPADDTVQLNGGYWNAPSVRASLGFSTNLNTLWTATDASNARSAVGLGATNNVIFGRAHLNDTGGYTLSLGDTNTGFRLISGGSSLFGFHKLGVLIWDISTTNNTFNIAVPMTFGTNAATTRTNLGLGWSALTNTNTSGFNASLYGSNTNPVLVNTNGNVVSPTNFWEVAPIQTAVQDFTGIATSQTNNATNARNVYIYSLATNVSAISNTIILPTNTSTFNGDEVCVIHKGTTNTTTVVRQAGSTNNLITLNRFDESVKFIRELGQWDFYHNISFVEPIQFSGTNASANVAASRTNLGIPLAALTNTNNATFQEAIFTTNAAPTNTANVNTVNFNTAISWMAVNIVTNGVTNTFHIPLFK